MIAHLHHGARLHARIPFPFNIVGSRYEYVLMKILGKLTDMDRIYRHRVTESLVDALANRVVLPLIHGEVLTPDEVENMVRRLEGEGHAMALGTCECRHGMGTMEKGDEMGRDPNLTCVMIGDWGKGHLYSYPRQYRHATADELIDLARFWHQRGRVLTAWGCCDFHGFLISYCHCHPRYCATSSNGETAFSIPVTASPGWMRSSVVGSTGAARSASSAATLGRSPSSKGWPRWTRASAMVARSAVPAVPAAP